VSEPLEEAQPEPVENLVTPELPEENIKVEAKIAEPESEVQEPIIDSKEDTSESPEPELESSEPPTPKAAPSKIAAFEPIALSEITDDDLFGASSPAPGAEAVSQDTLPQENPSDAEPPPYSEELPPDFWDSEAVETKTEAPTSASAAPQSGPRQNVAQKTAPQQRTDPETPKTFDKDAPVLEQLQSLFPGRITRIEPLEPNKTDDAATLEEDVEQESLFD